LCNERNARIHVAATVAVLLLSAWLRLEPVEWALIGVAIGMVFAGEMMNTVVELMVDMLMPREHELAKHAKDVAAGAILVFALTAAFIGAVVLGARLLARLGLG
ncbi:MAG: diacylglycerol kinase family protein, partial [Chloroflexi bacterium]|nr:diacylglycerol kinase family protein [Chloroflexota bacterium]